MPWFDTFDAIVPQRFPGMEIGKEEPMDRHTTFRVGGPARRFVRPGSEEACGALLELAEAQAWPVLVVGNGSNLLVSDEGLDRLVIHTGGLDSLERTGERTIRAGAGVSLARLASFAQKEGLG
ncbi:MAG: FAD-binding protein, partial [Oscillospiraceae bacterium]|nr:FAD-binding protein [Oscillospiraceae bacterium]